MLEGINISKTIHEKEILRDVNIRIEPAKISCLIGPSGAGKSTLLSCLSLLINPTNGSVNVDDKTFKFDTGHEKYKNFPYPLVTVVFQGLFLWPHLTNKENILLPLRDQNMLTNDYERIVSLLKIDAILNKYPNECSGGEKQRVALTRQILLKPKYLLLDEITSALDVEMENTLANLLIEIKNKGTGIMLVTHMVGLAKKISDNFYFMDNGTIVENGEIEILKNPKSERLTRFLQIYN